MKNILILILLTFFFTACRDFFEQEVYVDIAEHEPRTVVNSIVGSEDTVFRVLVTRSLKMASDKDVDQVEKDAEVALKVNGNPVSEFWLDTTTNHFISDYIPSEGDTYELEVTVPGLPVATSSIQMPKKAVLSDVKIGGKRFDQEGDEYQAVKFTLTDIPNEANFFEVALFSEYSYEDEEGEQHISRNSISWILSPMTFMTKTDHGLAFTDKAFENKSIDLEVWIGYWDWEYAGDEVLYLEVRSTTESYYEYGTTFYIHEWNQYPDLFSGEPVPMYSNIEGGYGVFSAYSADEAVVEED